MFPNNEPQSVTSSCNEFLECLSAMWLCVAKHRERFKLCAQDFSKLLGMVRCLSLEVMVRRVSESVGTEGAFRSFTHTVYGVM